MTKTDAGSRPLLTKLLTLVAILMVHFFAMLLVSVELITIVPMHINLFAETDVELPIATLHVMDLSYFFVKFWYLIVTLGMTADITVLVLLIFVATKKKWLLSIYSHLWLIAVILLFAYVSIALSFPVESSANTIGANAGP